MEPKESRGRGIVELLRQLPNVGELGVRITRDGVEFRRAVLATDVVERSTSPSGFVKASRRGTAIILDAETQCNVRGRLAWGNKQLRLPRRQLQDVALRRAVVLCGSRGSNNELRKSNNREEDVHWRDHDRTKVVKLSNRGKREEEGRVQNR